MIDRIKELMEHKGHTSSQFADTVEVPRAVISHILSGRNKPSLEVITKIVSAFPEVNMGWLILGEGDMLTPLASPVVPKTEAVGVKEVEPIHNSMIEEKKLNTGKVQNKNAPATSTLPGEPSDKAIEQIVIFYTDKTFMAYKP